MYKSLVITVLILVAAAAVFAAQPGEFGEDQFGYQTQLDEILLLDGTLLRGTIVSDSEEVVILETESMGRLEIQRNDIDRVVYGHERIGFATDPDYNSLMFCPTPATLEAGDSYFRDFELFVLNFGISISDMVDLSLGTLFPFSADALMVSLGTKVRLLDRETGPLGLALVGSYTRLESIHFSAVGAVAGVGNRHHSFNLMLNQAYDDDGDSETVVIVGGDTQVLRHTKLFAEYMSTASLLERENDDLAGFVNLGFRLFGDNHSFSLSGFRPLDDSLDSFIAFPMLMYSHHF